MSKKTESPKSKAGDQETTASSPESNAGPSVQELQNQLDALQIQITEKEAAIKVGEAQIQTLRDQLLRTAAEFENYKRRNDQERSDLRKYDGESLIKSVLPVLDDFERSFTALEKSPDPAVFIDGIRLISSNLVKILEQKGVKPIDCIGQAFDVNLHDALMHMEKEGVPPDQVIDEVQKGYTLNGKVIRHSKVLVSK